MIQQPTSLSTLEETICKAIESQVDAEKEQIIKTAVAEFEKRIRTIVGQMTIELAQYYSIERLGSDLVIRVRIETGKETPPW